VGNGIEPGLASAALASSVSCNPAAPWANFSKSLAFIFCADRTELGLDFSEPDLPQPLLGNPMTQKWTTLVCVSAFALTFGVACLLMGQGRNQPAQADAGPKPAVSAGVTTEAGPQDAKKPEITPDEEDRSPRPPPRSPVLISKWDLPVETKNPNYEQIRAFNVFLDASGRRLVTQSRWETICWDAQTGQALMRLKADKRAVSGKLPNGTATYIDQEICVSPDARVVALIHRDGSQVALHAADSGRLIGTYTPPKNGQIFTDWNHPAFTLGGQYLFLQVCLKFPGRHDRFAFAAISTRTGEGRILDIPDSGKDRYSYTALLPVPGQAALLCDQNNDGRSARVKSIDLSTGKERPITGVEDVCNSTFPQSGIRVSPDGRYLLATGFGTVQVCDWRSGRKFLKVSAGNGWFTADGKRCLILSNSVPAIYRVNRETGQRYTFEGTPFEDSLDLYDIESQKKIASLAMEKYGFGGECQLSVSGDGKFFALATRTTRVGVFDFQAAFDVAPLPSYPLFQETERLRLQ
jgi:hypothetical protein